MPQQTSQQLQSALNPTAFNVSVPGDGVYSSGPNGEILIKTGNTLFQTSLQDLGWRYSKTLSPADFERANGSGSYAISLGNQYLQSLGLSYNNIPTINATDLLGNASKLGLSFSNNLDLTNLPQLLKTAQTPGTSQTLNTQQNSIDPNAIAASQTAQTQQLAGYRGQNVTQSGTTPLAGQSSGAIPMSGNYYNSPGGTSGTGPAGTASGSSGQPDLANLPPEFQALYSQLEQYLARLQKNGQVLNPSIQLTPDKIAQFLQQAHTEIDPYYSKQLKLATETLSSSLGYQSNQVLNNEQRTENDYNTNLRTLGESAADKGFAQSGYRVRDENQLATDTQNSINDARSALYQNAGNNARQYAQNYGTSNLPQLNIGGAPSVTSGQSGFGKSSSQLPLYQLSPEVYGGLTGSQEYQQNTDVQNRASQLESAFRSNDAITQQRQLIL